MSQSNDPPSNNMSATGIIPANSVKSNENTTNYSIEAASNLNGLSTHTDNPYVQMASLFSLGDGGGGNQQEFFIPGRIYGKEAVNMLEVRLNGLCKSKMSFYDRETVYNFSGSTGFQCRMRTSFFAPPKSRLSVASLRYLGMVEQDKNILRRPCLEISCTLDTANFLKDIGFTEEFSYVTEGIAYHLGNVKILIYKLCKSQYNPALDKIEYKQFIQKPFFICEVTATGYLVDSELANEVHQVFEMLNPLVKSMRTDFVVKGFR